MKKHPASYDFLEGEILLLDKPLGWTSFDVVNHVRISLRDFLGLPRVKVGHAGTLDPLATGLLILCSGKATRQIEGLQGMDKTYTGTFMLGATTPSYDLETEIDATFPWKHLNEETIYQTARSFIGIQDQVPPIYSAVHVDGRRAYKMARKKTPDVIIPSRQIAILQFDITRIEFPSIDFLVKVSKGTYIRSLVNDFGKRCHSGAHLIELRRIASGDLHVDHAIDPLALRQWLQSSQNH